MSRVIVTLSLILQVFLPSSSLWSLELEGMFLTWQGDPSTTMTVQWLTPLTEEESLVAYRSTHGEVLHLVRGTYEIIPNTDLALHRVELTGLKSGTEYRFHLGEDPTEYRFRTLPKELDDSLRFVIGGDAYHEELDVIIDAYQVAAKFNPHFAVIGGDIAYSADASKRGRDSFKRWHEFVRSWQEHMVTPDGLCIPLITCIGNHETVGRYGQPTSHAPYYYALFPFPGESGAGALHFGNYLSLYLLDSGHTHSIAGDQKAWLKEALKEKQDVPHRFAVYHVPAYPSVRHHTKHYSRIVRKHWCPLFDEHDLDIAFEHHDHHYKRTYPIKDNKVDPDGVLYIGDGCWGAAPRKVKHNYKRWFLEKSAPKQHVIGVVLTNESRELFAIEAGTGAVFDHVKQVSKRPLDSKKASAL